MSETDHYRAGERILRIAAEFPDRPALVIDGESWTYGELTAAALSLAAQFPAIGSEDAQPMSRNATPDAGRTTTRNCGALKRTMWRMTSRNHTLGL